MRSCRFGAAAFHFEAVFAIFEGMNHIYLKSCVFNNFMSYGNTVNEFTFPNGVVWMTADNGSGKSTLVEAINFALFGKSYRGGNKAELRNTRNVDGITRVMLEFDYETSNGDRYEYRVTRSISPKGTVKFEIERKDGDQWVVQNKRAGFSQQDFEDTILGFNEILFKNVIAMNTQETTPFCEMEAAERRKLLESILALSLDPMKKETARRLSNESTAFDIADNDITRINGDIANLSTICERLKQEKQENVELLEQQLAAESASMTASTEKVNGLVAALTAKKNEVDGYATQAAGEQGIDQAIAAIQAAGSEISVLKRNRDELAVKERELAEVTDKYNAMPGEVLKHQLDDLNLTLKKKNEGRRATEGDIASANARAASFESRMNEITAQAKAMKPGVPCPTCGKPSTEEDIEKHKVEFRRQWVELRDKANIEKGLAESQTQLLNELIASIDKAEAKKAELERQIAEITNFYNSVVVPASTVVNSLRAAVMQSEAVVAAAGVDPAQFTAELDRLTAEKQKFPEIRLKWQTAYDEYNRLTADYTTADGEMRTAAANVSRLQGEIAKAKERAENDSLALTEKQLEDARKELADAESRLHTASDNRLAYEYIGKRMCADSGLKKMIFSNFVPSFNASVMRNITKLNLPFSVEFADDMSVIFHPDPGGAPSYEMLSQGQRRKLGFAISMAFRDFYMLIGNFNLNFLSMDEVLDVSTDDNGMREMMDIVRGMAEEIGCALVITHRGSVVADKFDYRIKVEHDGNYSSLGELEKL